LANERFWRLYARYRQPQKKISLMDLLRRRPNHWKTVNINNMKNPISAKWFSKTLNVMLQFKIILVLVVCFWMNKVNAQQTTIESKQALDLFFKYSYYDVYHIQKKMPSNANCLKSKIVTNEIAGETKTIYDPFPIYNKNGSLENIRYDKREVRTPSTYTQSIVYTNTCPTEVFVKGIRTYKNKEGMIVYQDHSYYLEPNESVDLGQFPEYYNPEKHSLGYVQYYKNPLPINSTDYDQYLKLIANKLTGTLAVESFSKRTRIFLNKGDKVYLRAKGQIKVGPFAGYSGPDGIEGLNIYNFTPNAKHGSLVYNITSGTDWYPVGEYKIITANKTGMLRLTVNDDEPDNNQGYYEVEYSINKPLSDTTPNYQSQQNTTTNNGAAKTETNKQASTTTNRATQTKEQTEPELTQEMKDAAWKAYQETSEKLKNVDTGIPSSRGTGGYKNPNDNAKPYGSMPKSYSGTISNKSTNRTSNCQMTLTTNSDGTYQLSGSTDNVNVVGKWNLTGVLKEDAGKKYYVFKGDILLGYEGSNWPLGTKAPFVVIAEITERGIKGNYTIMSNYNGVNRQEGVFNIR
jgi:hypothetical protein